MPLPAPRPVQRLPFVGRPRFKQEFFGRAPLVLTEVVRRWPAAAWTPQSLAHQGGGCEVLVERYARGGASYGRQLLAGGRTLSLAAFVAEIEGAAESVEAYTWSLRESPKIFEAHPELLDALDFDGVFVSSGTEVRHSLWLGPAGYVTGLHTDEIDLNLLAHLYGKKTVTFYAPEDTPKLYPETDKPTYGGFYSAVDAWEPDLVRHPLFAEAQAYVAELVPGDLLYVPRGFWHKVVSHTVSVSVSGFLDRF